MRKTFINTLIEIAEKDHRIMLLTGDLGFMVMEPFIERFPDRFINVGVAEQNLIGIATGLAESGMIPYVYSITPFAVLRPYEFIRNGPIYHHLQVRIVGAGGGVEYGNDGISHYGIDDVGVLRVQPGISIFAPADYQQAKTIFTKTWDMPGPIYYRLSKDEKTIIPGLSGEFNPEEAQLIGNGKDILFISLGPIGIEAVKAIEELKNRGFSGSLLIVSSINPVPFSDLEKIIPQFKTVITVEAHYINGGLGSLICEFVAGRNEDCTVLRCGIESMPNGQIGTQEYLYQKNGISSEALVEKAITLLEKRKISPSHL
jgi:transketolase